MIYNDDCLKVFPTIPDKSVDLVVTDCPYHIVSGGCANPDSFNIPSGILNKRKSDEGQQDVELMKQGKIFEYNDIEFKDWLPDVYRVLKDGTHCYIMINPRNLKELWQVAEDVGFKFQQLLVWDKGNVTPNRYYLNAYELILMLRKGKAKPIVNKGDKNILRIPNILRTKKHPTQKPVELMKALILNSSNEGDIVLDPFMGVGGAMVACKELNREFIGIEIDEKYFNIAKEQLDTNHSE